MAFVIAGALPMSAAWFAIEETRDGNAQPGWRSVVRVGLVVVLLGLALTALVRA